jgi:L-threonylcarbamoyladenylate synthase
VTEGILREAVEQLAAGHVVGVPTDTVYGLAVDPWNEEAVALLYELKGRPAGKPVGLLAASVEQVEEIADLGVGADLARSHWPGALTLVVRPRVVIPDWVGDKALGTVGVRVPDHDLLRGLLAATGPLAVTSANRSGEADLVDDTSARAVFGVQVAAYLPGKSPGGTASTVVDVSGRKLRVLRQGPIIVG